MRSEETISMSATDKALEKQRPGEKSLASAKPALAAYPVIDCDIHNEVPSLKTLLPYLPVHWQAYINESAFVGPDANDYPKNAPTTARPGSRPADGPPGSDLALLAEQVLDVWEVDYAILANTYWVQSVHLEDLAADLATAINQWQIDEWLEKEPRLRASLVLPSQNPVLAAREIERFGDHPGFVQVIMPVRSLIPYGKRYYDPIYEAAIKHGLAIGIHYGGAPGHAPTPTGWPSTYLEEYAGMAQVFQSQVWSLVIEGTFDRFPDLRMALIEGGFTWLPSLMWRMDKEWKGLRHNTPWVKQLPSAYIRQHMRLTVQPVNAPPQPELLYQILEQIESDELLMFSTDYPHWHFDSDDEAWPVALPEASMEKLMAGNARAFYSLPARVERT
jgi:predicted TIM-barrel fold metal-dependent hydrolase